ncbi:MAG: type I restriction-modification system subunit M N-terminal domain-containing protein [Microcella sp.]|nr:type I restriction-modification system subunit M N-terminal domain-containing protein [Microcella sp.]
MKQRDELDQPSEDETSDYFTSTDAARQGLLDDRDEYTGDGFFWAPEGHRWDDLRKAAKHADSGRRIDDAMDEIEKENPSLKGFLPRSYSRRELTPPRSAA